MNIKEDKIIKENDLFVYCNNRITTVKSSKCSIFSCDPKAIEKLEKRIILLQEEKEKVKAREHCYYELPYINTEIENIRNRIRDIKDLKSLEFENMIFADWRIVHNKEFDKIQIFFDKKPDDDVLWILEYRGFRYRKNQGAWQLSFNSRTVYLAKTIAEEIENRK